MADLFGLASDLAKYDHHSGGRAEWLAKVHAIELSKITPAKIQEWKHSFLAAAGNDPLALADSPHPLTFVSDFGSKKRQKF